jgi:hypothetical protein
MSFVFQLSSDVSSGGYFTLTFSSGMDLSSSSSVSCSAIYGLNGNTPTCTRTSSTVLRVSNVFANTDKYIMLEVRNAKLPSYVSTFTVKVQTYDSSNTLIESSGDNTFKFTTTPGSLELTLTSLSSVVAGEYCNLQISVKLTTALATTGYLLMTLPKWNPGT